MARLPARILEHPVESAVASLLLLALLLGSADFTPTSGASGVRMQGQNVSQSSAQ